MEVVTKAGLTVSALVADTRQYEPNIFFTTE
jgi:hypothetical protein